MKWFIQPTKSYTRYLQSVDLDLLSLILVSFSSDFHLDRIFSQQKDWKELAAISGLRLTAAILDPNDQVVPNIGHFGEKEKKVQNSFLWTFSSLVLINLSGWLKLTGSDRSPQNNHFVLNAEAKTQ